ncbi:chaoptin [Periplaneta americana]|uniref:chaoptin n=1 Tax=Periplaneta americana TaxID=6978 RepID=UPI0037E7312E
MSVRVTMVVLVMAAFAPPHQGQQVAPCTFNSMCSCKFGGGDTRGIHFTTPKSLESVKDISCVGVPFSKLPDLPGGQVAHMDVVNSGLEALENEALGGSQIESLRLMSNKIQHVGERTFSSMADVLKSLDLSYNELGEVPFEALQPLRSLDWLNFHSNQISSLTTGDGGGDWSFMRDTLTNVFLGENDLTELPKERSGNGNGDNNNHHNGNGNGNGGGTEAGNGSGASLAECRMLTWLNVDSNKVMALEPGSLPESLQTLSASHNLIARFPAEALDNLQGLAWLYLRGNFLEELPDYTFKHHKRLDKLDLGENSIQSIPHNVFNNSLTVRDLNLDFNHLKTLPAQAFRGLSPGRIYLSMNKLEGMDDRAFVGISHSLEFLDLEQNNLQRIPKALSQLKRLKYLYIPSNKISEVPDDAFESFSGSLRALSLSGNQLSRIPREALKDCKKLSHLNVGYNQIYEVEEEDFLRWGGSLDTLLLRNNRIARLDAHVFRQTPRLRELSLSFNKLSDVDPEAFIDVASSLENLEVSFGMYREDFPEDFLKPLTSLLWLALDNNNFRTISPTALYTFGQLHYLNLEANRLEYLPPEVFHPNVHKNLHDVRLSYNHIEILESETFASLRELRTVVLTGNRIRAVKTGAFRGLPNLVTLVISDNRINSLEPRSLTELPNLIKLDLQNNELKEFSLSAFLNVTGFFMPMTINISRNQISSLYTGDTGTPLHVKTLDLSHNRVPEVPVNFLQTFSDSLRRLHMGYNRIGRLDPTAFGNLDLLEVLTLEHNSIVTLRKRAFDGIEALQVLDLSHNHIEQLQVEQFTNLENLRIVDLSHNHIRSLPRDVFQNTKLERLDLSNNEFVVMPSSALGEVGYTLRYLDMSHNHVEHLDSTMFPDTPYLLGLNLAHNKLTILPDNVFTSLGGLLKLDLSSNPLRANFKELFHYVQKLRHLNLADTGLKVTPNLPLPNLVSLNLSSNSIEEMSAAAVEGLERLRSLYLYGNRFTSVPSQAWPYMPLLKNLDVSKNNIKIITKESFSGLNRLQTLVIQDLPLERFDGDTLTRLRLLTSLRIQTWPKIEKYRFRLGNALSNIPSLRKLSVRVLESSLTDQLLGAFTPRLRHLEITGSELRSIDSDAFEGIEENYELVLQIRGTQIEELPSGLFAKLEKIPHLSLDLRDNKFSSLSPGTLYSNGTSWENVGTKLISGGLILKGNPWTCECGLVWLGHWLRRWLRETMQIHTVVLEGAQQMQSLAREATCTDPRTGQQTPILDLYPEDLSCHASALSRGGSSSRCAFTSRHHRTLVALVLLYWWSW